MGDEGRASNSELPSSASQSAEQAKLFVIGPPPHPEAMLLDRPYRELRMPLQRLEKTRFNRWKRSLQAVGLIPLPSHRRVQRLLEGFRPEVVVSVMQGTPFISVAARTARAFGVPLVLIVHDLNEEFERVFPWAKRALFGKNREVYRAASRRLCVSPEMAEYLEKRYGVPGEVMYPNRSEELLPRAAELSLALRTAADQKTKSRKDQEPSGARQREAQPRANQETYGSQAGDFDSDHFDILKDSSLVTRHSSQASASLTLGYAGSLAYGYGEELMRLIDVFRATGTRIRLFSPRPTGRLAALNDAQDVVEVCGYRPALEAWREIQQTCDAVILPYANPAGEQEMLYRTHFPSKLTEYLALGMPVIVSGPGLATGVRWALGEMREARGKRQEAGDGKENFERGHFDILKRSPNGAIPCTSRQELVAVLQGLREDGALREELARRAVEAGKRDFDPVAIRVRFWEILRGSGEAVNEKLKAETGAPEAL